MPVAKKNTAKKKPVKRTPARRAVAPRAVVAKPVERKRSMVGPLTAVKNFWVRYFDFMGRATRSEFWFGLLFAFIVNWACTYFIGKNFPIIAMAISAVLFIPVMALCVRRFRDAGVSVWWYLIPALFVYLIPIVRGPAWYGMMAFGYVSSGMVLYSLFFIAFGIFELVVGCLPSKR